ncbi:hypothetical protein, partial [Paracoccus limosus]|uniref:hypothetical protein n=1 Tax=Paracoccus limosus TaxID=913252 RepID=UPI001B86780B
MLGKREILAGQRASAAGERRAALLRLLRNRVSFVTNLRKKISILRQISCLPSFFHLRVWFVGPRYRLTETAAASDGTDGPGSTWEVWENSG